MRTELALAAVSLYAIAITVRHAQAHRMAAASVNPLCLRDFVEPTTSGTCLCGENSVRHALSQHAATPQFPPPSQPQHPSSSTFT